MNCCAERQRNVDTLEKKTLSDIPEPTANTGYENGSWDTEPTESTPVVDGAEYTYTYVAEALQSTTSWMMRKAL